MDLAGLPLACLQQNLQAFLALAKRQTAAIESVSEQQIEGKEDQFPSLAVRQRRLE